MKKRLLSVVLSLCLAITFLPVTSLAASSIPFQDVKSGIWYYDAIAYVFEKGLMNGTSGDTFQPDAALTRAQICQILYNMESTPQTDSNNFTDVSSSEWYYQAVNWAADHSIVSGVGDEKFQPDGLLTREQMMTIIYRYAEYKDYDVSDSVSLSDFTDADAVSDWAETAMKWAVGAGIITGATDTTIVPAGTATRAQAATILMRFCESFDGTQEDKDSDSSFSSYEDILDIFYNGISNQWADDDDSTDVSYMWYMDPDASLSNTGYALIDLDGDGVSELLVSKDSESWGAGDGMIYDLYTLRDGKVIHLASSSERDRYYLCNDNMIANEASDSAWDTRYSFYTVSSDEDGLVLKESIVYHGQEDEETPWLHGTSEAGELTPIEEEEAQQMIDSYEHLPFDLSLFDSYTPS